jgi:hypothetical protein
MAAGTMPPFIAEAEGSGENACSSLRGFVNVSAFWKGEGLARSDVEPNLSPKPKRGLGRFDLRRRRQGAAGI